MTCVDHSLPGFLVLLELRGKRMILKMPEIWVRKSCILHKAGNILQFFTQDVKRYVH